MPESKAQVRLAHAVLSGNAKASMPARVAAEIVGEMHGRKMSSLPARKGKRRRFNL